MSQPASATGGNGHWGSAGGLESRDFGPGWLLSLFAYGTVPRMGSVEVVGGRIAMTVIEA